MSSRRSRYIKDFDRFWADFSNRLVTNKKHFKECKVCQKMVKECIVKLKKLSRQ